MPISRSISRALRAAALPRAHSEKGKFTTAATAATGAITADAAYGSILEPVYISLTPRSINKVPARAAIADELGSAGVEILFIFFGGKEEDECGCGSEKFLGRSL